ncbi:hypothetical protein [Chlorogloea sp. CCALA 695]|uniref:hypothetical protein n=1 Tax=Chlorogloea sp. CCALA 695 TaxID=2107693 RepID=UPI0018ECE252|nr:hypothetical protein [Chlorogloea sp. CCALA 695]
MTKVGEKRERGMPHAPLGHVLNTLMYVLITGCRPCDVPKGEIWASKSSAHRWLCAKSKRMERWNDYKRRILGIAEERGLINWNYGAVDGPVSPWKGRR